MSVAWKELENNLIASQELTRLAREKEEVVMKEWDNFHDYTEAREYSEKWYTWSRVTRRKSRRRPIFAVNEPRGPARLVKIAKLSRKLVASARPRKKRRPRSRLNYRGPGQRRKQP